MEVVEDTIFGRALPSIVEQLNRLCFCGICQLIHYITLSAFRTPPTPKVTSGASTITCYTKYSPLAQHAGQLHSKSGTTKKENQLCSGANCSNTHNINSSMAPHEFNVLRTTTDEFNTTETGRTQCKAATINQLVCPSYSLHVQLLCYRCTTPEK